jgi:hypothetical protein
MSRTKKIIAGIIVAILVLVLGGFMFIDAIAASVLRSQGTSLLGVQTNVSSIRLGLLTQETSLTGLSIANPKGFGKPEFVHIDKMDIAASVGTMLSSTIDIPTVTIDGLALDLEQIDDRLNATVIVDHVTKATASADGTADSNADPVHLTIGELSITNIKLTASGSIVNIAGGRLDTTIPSITIQNVGTKTEGGDIAGQAISLALSILMKHIMDNPVQGLSGAAVGSVATALEAIPGLRTLGVGKALLDVNRTLNDGVSKARQGLKDVGGSLTGGLSDLIGGGKKKGEGNDDTSADDKGEGNDDKGEG